MQVELTPEQEMFISRAVQSGRFQREEDAVKEALALWEERERARTKFIATLDKAEASVANGEGRAITRESMRDLAEEIHQRGLASLASKNSTER